MNPGTDISTLFKINKAFADAHFPKNRGVVVTILSDGEPTIIRVPVELSCDGAAVVAAPPLVNRGSGLTEMEEDIVQVVDELADDDAAISTEELAEKSGYPLSSRFREALARLSRNGVISSRRPGYGKAR